MKERESIKPRVQDLQLYFKMCQSYFKLRLLITQLVSSKSFLALKSNRTNRYFALLFWLNSYYFQTICLCFFIFKITVQFHCGLNKDKTNAKKYNCIPIFYFEFQFLLLRNNTVWYFRFIKTMVCPDTTFKQKITVWKLKAKIK